MDRDSSLEIGGDRRVTGGTWHPNELTTSKGADVMVFRAVDNRSSVLRSLSEGWFRLFGQRTADGMWEAQS
jgi:hypothetical protein